MTAERNQSHPSCVDAWLKSNAAGLELASLLDLFEQAMQGIHVCARATLSEVTLTAVLERVLYTSQERYPFLSSIQIGETEISFAKLKKSVRTQKPEELIEGLRFMLIEFLALLGSLTGQVITPALHSQLAKTYSQKRAKK